MSTKTLIHIAVSSEMAELLSTRRHLLDPAKTHADKRDWLDRLDNVNHQIATHVEAALQNAFAQNPVTL